MAHKKNIIALCCLVLLFTTGIVIQDNLLSSIESEIINSNALRKSIKSLVLSQLLDYCINPVVVEAVTNQNNSNMTFDAIAKIDSKWQNAPENYPEIKERLENPCAIALRSLKNRNQQILEAFIMDNKGAIVAATNKTSDFWQGDEAKWQKSFNDGKGGAFIGKVRFDLSVDTIVQVISLPVINNDGFVVGAITFNISIK